MMSLRDIIRVAKLIAEVVELPDFNDRGAAYAWILRVINLAKEVAALSPNTVDDLVVDALSRLAANEAAVMAIMDFVLELLPQRRFKSSLTLSERIEVVADVLGTLEREAYGAFCENGYQAQVDAIAQKAGIDPILLAKILSIIIQLIVRLL